MENQYCTGVLRIRLLADNEAPRPQGSRRAQLKSKPRRVCGTGGARAGSGVGSFSPHPEGVRCGLTRGCRSTSADRGADDRSGAYAVSCGALRGDRAAALPIMACSSALRDATVAAGLAREGTDCGGRWQGTLRAPVIAGRPVGAIALRNSTSQRMLTRHASLIKKRIRHACRHASRH
jgi:hypothetical protein